MGRRQFDMENANDHAAAGIRFTPEERIGTHGIAWHINDSRDVVGLASPTTPGCMRSWGSAAR